jgi:hypothetical protein
MEVSTTRTPAPSRAEPVTRHGRYRCLDIIRPPSEGAACGETGLASSFVFAKRKVELQLRMRLMFCQRRIPPLDLQSSVRINIRRWLLLPRRPPVRALLSWRESKFKDTQTGSSPSGWREAYCILKTSTEWKRRQSKSQIIAQNQTQLFAHLRPGGRAIVLSSVYSFSGVSM